MKFSLLSKHASAPEKLLNITQSLYDDPAFSPDPLANPFFASHHPPAWSSPLGPGHPTLRKPSRPVDSEEFCPPPPPNTPEVPDESPANPPIVHSTASSIPTRSPDSPPNLDPLSSPSPSYTLFPSAVPPSSPLSTLTVSAPHVHPTTEMPHHAHHPPLQRTKNDLSKRPEPKKRQGLFSRLLGSPSVTESSESGSGSFSSPPNHLRNNRPEKVMMRTQRPPLHPNYRTAPQHDHVAVAAPTPVPFHRAPRSAPEMHQPERPLMPQRTKTAGTAEPNAGAGRVIVAAVAAAAAAGRAADEWHLRQDLDRIDELDETNPFGSALHHGGPYEAVSRFVQKDPTPKETGRPLWDQATNGRKLVMSGDIYRDAQLMALQTGSLNLKPGQILAHDFSLYPNPSHAYTHPHPAHLHPQPNSYHDRHTYLPSGALVQEEEPRTSSEHPALTQTGASVLQAGSLGDHPIASGTTSSNSSLPTRSRTPSPTVATTHSDEEDDAGLAIGMALMDPRQDHSLASSDTATVVGPDIVNNSPVPIKIVLREPTDPDEPSPPPYVLDLPQASTSRTEVPVINEISPGAIAAVEISTRGEIWEAPHIDVPQHFPNVASTPHVPVPTPIPTSSPSRHASWHALPSQAPPQIYSRPSRQDIHSLQPPPPQQHVTPVSPGLSRSSTYAAGSLGPYSDRLTLASTFKANNGSPYSSTPSLRDRESDVRSVQQSIMTTSNASSRSQGENFRRNRYMPKRLVMPAPLQPTMQNQATTHQIRFDPQANAIVYPRETFPQKQTKRASQPSRAQDVQTTQPNNKLRKRISLIGSMASTNQPQPPPVAAVSFSANVVSADRHARGTEKAHRKVLSKRK